MVAQQDTKKKKRHTLGHLMLYRYVEQTIWTKGTTVENEHQEVRVRIMATNVKRTTAKQTK